MVSLLTRPANHSTSSLPYLLTDWMALNRTFRFGRRLNTDEHLRKQQARSRLLDISRSAQKRLRDHDDENLPKSQSELS
jgi:hypothetical protein